MDDQREHPMLMKGELVVATLEGRKTQTRRLVTRQNSVAYGWPSLKWSRLDWSRASPGIMASDDTEAWLWRVPLVDSPDDGSVMIMPRVRAGDTLWVREAWRSVNVLDDCAPNLLGRFNAMLYEADQSPRWEGRVAEWGKLRPSIHMPRWACRLELPVTSVGAERVQDISEEDALAEGAGRAQYPSPLREEFSNLWDDINGEREGASWSANPPLWVYQWEPVHRECNACGATTDGREYCDPCERRCAEGGHL